MTVDTFGEISTDGTNSPWEYSDGWAYRSSGTGPDGQNFQRASWTFSGVNALDNAATNEAAASPMPIGQYTLSPPLGSCLLLTGVFDGPLPGGLPKGVELLATCAIPDLRRYGLGSANNGGGTDGVEYNLGAGSLSAGAFMYISSEADKFEEFFGFAPSATSGTLTVNGDDAIELFLDGVVVHLTLS